jgi:hypothetical protein
MTHPLVIGLFPSPQRAASGARAVHALGIPRDQLSVLSRNHDEAGAFAEQMDVTPGVDLEDSRPAARLGELSGQVLAAIALVLPGIGPIVAAGPLSAGLGEAAGHLAGGLASVLSHAGIPEDRAEALQQAVHGGAVIIGVHVLEGSVAPIRAALAESGATTVDTANWSEGG